MWLWKFITFLTSLVEQTGTTELKKAGIKQMYVSYFNEVTIYSLKITNLAS